LPARLKTFRQCVVDAIIEKITFLLVAISSVDRQVNLHRGQFLVHGRSVDVDEAEFTRISHT